MSKQISRNQKGGEGNWYLVNSKPVNNDLQMHVYKNTEKRNSNINATILISADGPWFPHVSVKYTDKYKNEYECHYGYPVGSNKEKHWVTSDVDNFTCPKNIKRVAYKLYGEFKAFLSNPENY